MKSKEAEQIRKDLNLTQEKMGNKIGVTRQAIIRYEGGGSIPQSIQNLYNLIKRYEVE